MDILLGLITAAVALLLLFGGYRLGRIAIPLWGFIVGVSLGGAVAGDLADTPFLATFAGIFVGLAMGLLFAILAYLYYGFAVIMLVAGVGYWLGSGFFLLLGLQPGLISALSGLALGLAFGLAALLFNAPKYVLIVLSSVAGAVLMVGAIMLIFNQLPRESFSYATARAVVADSVWWSIVAVLLAIGGMVVQIATTARYEFEKWYGIGEDVSPTQTPTPHAPQHM
jgi:hypothetical protein